MRFSPRKLAAILTFAFLFAILFVSAVSAAESTASLSPVPNSTSHKMEVGIFVNSIDNLDFIRGTYSMDFYLHFRWTDPAIKTAQFEIMNGQPSAGSHSLEKLSNISGPVNEEWYRVRADFTTTPNVRDFPFESGNTPIEIEDANNDITHLTFVPLTNESGIDPEFTLPGWKIGKPVFAVANHTYPWGETYSKLSYEVPVTKNAIDSLIQTIIPPLIFCLIGMLSFFIKVEHPELVHLRYVLTTSMFISTVMYHFSQLALIPGLGMLKLFDKFMIAVYLFLAVTIAVTTLCYLAYHQWNRPDLVQRINRTGAIVSLVLPVVVFWLLATFV